MQSVAGPYQFKSLVNFHLTPSHRYLCLKTGPTVARSVGWQPRSRHRRTSEQPAARASAATPPREHAAAVPGKHVGVGRVGWLPREASHAAVA